MPGRGALSEEAQRQEEESRIWLRSAEIRLRELRDRRAALIQEVRSLSADQRQLVAMRQPVRANLDSLLREHRALGQKLASLRLGRQALKTRLAEAETSLRHESGQPIRGEGPSPSTLRREVRALELRQQTNALPLEDENALIAQIRRLRQRLSETEQRAAGAESEAKARAAKAGVVRSLREELDRAGREAAACQRDRDARMDSMRTQLEEDGLRLAEIRAKGVARAAVVTRLETAGRELLDLERDMRRRVEESRRRWTEARDTLRNYNRGVRKAVTGERAVRETADAHLEELLKRGRVSLGG